MQTPHQARCSPSSRTHCGRAMPSGSNDVSRVAVPERGRGVLRITPRQLWHWVVEWERVRARSMGKVFARGQLKERLSGRVIEAGNPYALPPDVEVSLDARFLPGRLSA